MVRTGEDRDLCERHILYLIWSCKPEIYCPSWPAFTISCRHIRTWHQSKSFTRSGWERDHWGRTFTRWNRPGYRRGCAWSRHIIFAENYPFIIKVIYWYLNKMPRSLLYHDRYSSATSGIKAGVKRRHSYNEYFKTLLESPCEVIQSRISLACSISRKGGWHVSFRRLLPST